MGGHGLDIRLGNISPAPLSWTRTFKVSTMLLLDKVKLKALLEEHAARLKKEGDVSCGDCGLLTTYASDIHLPEVTLALRNDGFEGSTCMVERDYAEDGVWEGHRCPDHLPYQQGFTPKEHLEREDNRGWQERMAQQQRDHQRMMAKLQRKAFERVENRVFWYGLVLIGVLLVIATLAAPLITALLNGHN